jgi:hypothetical protein
MPADPVAQLEAWYAAHRHRSYGIFRDVGEPWQVELIGERDGYALWSGPTLAEAVTLALGEWARRYPGAVTVGADRGLTG